MDTALSLFPPLGRYKIRNYLAALMNCDIFMGLSLAWQATGSVQLAHGLATRPGHKQCGLLPAILASCTGWTDWTGQLLILSRANYESANCSRRGDTFNAQLTCRRPVRRFPKP